MNDGCYPDPMIPESHSSYLSLAEAQFVEIRVPTPKAVNRLGRLLKTDRSYNAPMFQPFSILRCGPPQAVAIKVLDLAVVGCSDQEFRPSHEFEVDRLVAHNPPSFVPYQSIEGDAHQV